MASSASASSFKKSPENSQNKSNLISFDELLEQLQALLQCSEDAKSRILADTKAIYDRVQDPNEQKELKE
jgi:hypothetical protein